MSLTSVSIVAGSQHIFWALSAFGSNEIADGVIVGLAVLAVVEIAAGLWLVRAGAGRRVRR
jgi:hypothetical protein